MRNFEKFMLIAVVPLFVAVFVVAIITSNQTRQLKELKESYEQEVAQCKQVIEEYKSVIHEKDEYIEDLKSEIEDLKGQLEVITETSDEESPKTSSSSYMENPSQDSGFRSYMSYTAITCTTSDQYKIVGMATPNENGLMTIDGYVVVAIGTGWGIGVGETATVTTENGSFNIVVGDIKDDRHTDWSNKITVSNGCVIEFITDTSVMPVSLKRSGNIATLDEYSGKVISITSNGGCYV